MLDLLAAQVSHPFSIKAQSLLIEFLSLLYNALVVLVQGLLPSFKAFELIVYHTILEEHHSMVRPH